jgi:glycosyltransferase involved in cell wall biosynthesis
LTPWSKKGKIAGHPGYNPEVSWLVMNESGLAIVSRSEQTSGEPAGRCSASRSGDNNPGDNNSHVPSLDVILHVITGLGNGGAERMLVRILLSNRSSNAPRPIVVSLMDLGVHGRALQESGIEVHCLNMRCRGISSLFGLLKLVAFMRRRRPDIIMTWLYHADLIGTIAALLAGLGTSRIIWNLRCSNIDFSTYSLVTRWVVRFLAMLSPLASVVVANSESGIRHHSELGYRPKRWVYLPNGFDLDEWRPERRDRAAVRAEWKFEEQVVAIGMIARVDAQKDYETLISAAARLCPADDRLRFVLIGKGTQKLAIPPALAGRVLALDERNDVQMLLRGLDIAVLTSNFGEGCPNVVGEAMATGIPCIVSDVGDSAILVGDAGIVIPPRSVENLANAVNFLVSAPAERRRRGQAGRGRIYRHFELSQVARMYNAVLRSAVITNESDPILDVQAVRERRIVSGFLTPRS